MDFWASLGKLYPSLLGGNKPLGQPNREAGRRPVRPHYNIKACHRPTCGGQDGLHQALNFEGKFEKRWGPTCHRPIPHFGVRPGVEGTLERSILSKTGIGSSTGPSITTPPPGGRGSSLRRLKRLLAGKKAAGWQPPLPPIDH